MMGGHYAQMQLQPPGDWGQTSPGAGMGTGTGSAAGNSAGGRCDSRSVKDGIEAAAADNPDDQPTLHG